MCECKIPVLVPVGKEVGYEIVDWVYLAQDRDRCSAGVKTVMNLWVS